MKPLFHRLVLAVSVIFLSATAGFAQTDTATLTTNAPADNSTNQAPAYYAPSSATAPPKAPAVSANPPGNIIQDDIYDIRPPYFYLRDWFWFWVALGLATLAALIVIFWYWFRPQRQLRSKTAYELALEKLEKARVFLREDMAMPYAVAVSETIRSYLGQRFQSPSARRTTEEFLRQMEIDPSSHLAEHRDLLRGFLQSCDLVKFARYQPTIMELERVQQNAFRFVTATKPIVPNGAAPS